MAIDTTEKKLSLLDCDLDCIEGIPLPDGGLDQGDKQHSLGSYSGILFNALTPGSGLPWYPSTWLVHDY